MLLWETTEFGRHAASVPRGSCLYLKTNIFTLQSFSHSTLHFVQGDRDREREGRWAEIKEWNTKQCEGLSEKLTTTSLNPWTYIFTCGCNKVNSLFASWDHMAALRYISTLQKCCYINVLSAHVLLNIHYLGLNPGFLAVWSYEDKSWSSWNIHYHIFASRFCGFSRIRKQYLPLLQNADWKSRLRWSKINEL